MSKEIGHVFHCTYKLLDILLNRKEQIKSWTSTVTAIFKYAGDTDLNYFEYFTAKARNIWVNDCPSWCRTMILPLNDSSFLLYRLRDVVFAVRQHWKSLTDWCNVALWSGRETSILRNQWCILNEWSGEAGLRSGGTKLHPSNIRAENFYFQGGSRGGDCPSPSSCEIRHCLEWDH